MEHDATDGANYLVPQTGTDQGGPAEAPPRREGFVRDRFLKSSDRDAKGWRRLDPVAQALAKGHLHDPELQNETAAQAAARHRRALDRKDAGDMFADHWANQDTAIRSVDMSAPGGGAVGAGIPYSECQAKAMQWLDSVKSELGGNDWLILVSVCGEGKKPSEAINLLYGDQYRKVVAARFREALDALITAIPVARAKRAARIAARTSGTN